MASVASLDVQIRGSTVKLAQALGRGEKSVGRFGKSVQKVSKAAQVALVGVAGAVAGASLRVVQLERDLRPMVERSRIAAESLQLLARAAERAGSEDGLEGIVDTSQELQLQLGELALTGSGRAKEALESLGLVAADLQAMQPEEAWRLVVEEIQRIPNAADKATAAEEIFGGTSEKIAGIVNLTNQEFAQLQEQLLATGGIMSQETLDSAQRLGNAVDDMKATIDGVVITLGGALAPHLTAAADLITNLVGVVQGWAKENPKLADTIGKLAVAGTAVLAVLASINLVTGAARILNLKLIPVLAKTTFAYAKMGIAIAAANLPLTLIIAAIAALAAGFVWAVRNIDGFVEVLTAGTRIALRAIEGFVNSAIKGLNLLIKGINLIPGINIPEIPEAEFADGLTNMLEGGLNAIKNFDMGSTIDGLVGNFGGGFNTGAQRELEEGGPALARAIEQGFNASESGTREGEAYGTALGVSAAESANEAFKRVYVNPVTGMTSKFGRQQVYVPGSVRSESQPGTPFDFDDESLPAGNSNGLVATLDAIEKNTANLTKATTPTIDSIIESARHTQIDESLLANFERAEKYRALGDDTREQEWMEGVARLTRAFEDYLGADIQGVNRDSQGRLVVNIDGKQLLEIADTGLGRLRESESLLGNTAIIGYTS